jgi:hypothetical protein
VEDKWDMIPIPSTDDVWPKNKLANWMKDFADESRKCVNKSFRTDEVTTNVSEPSPTRGRDCSVWNKSENKSGQARK